jgi:hypothetical protein
MLLAGVVVVVDGGEVEAADVDRARRRPDMAVLRRGREDVLLLGEKAGLPAEA